MRGIQPSKLMQELGADAKAGNAAMLWGPPGVGKSNIAYAFGESLGAKIYEIRANLFDPVDVRGGLKVVEQKNGTYKTRYGIPEDYPPSDYEGLVLLVIDELPNAPKATKNALLQLILDKKIGTYTLPKNTIIIGAGNRAEDRAAVHEMPTPAKNRFAHYTVEPSVDDWCAWAAKNNIDESVIAFIRYRPSLLSAMDTAENAFPTPRTWEMLSNKLPFMADMFYGCASLIGDGPAGEYVAFRSIYKDVPDFDKLIANPSTTKVPTETSVLYAIAAGLATRAHPKTFSAIMRYTKRMPPEYQVVVVRDCLAKDPTLTGEKAFTKWTEENAEVLL